MLLWKDESGPALLPQDDRRPKRSIGGMPHIVTVANGPGRIAFSRDAPGELVVLPLHPGMELDVREHAFLLASHSIQYSFVRIKGLANMLHGGNGMFMDRFVTAQQPGLLMLHGNGNVLERTLRPGEKILVEPGGFLYKDSSVTMQTVQIQLKTGMLGHHNMYLAEMTGPGRVGIQSMYVPPRLRGVAGRADEHLRLPVLPAAKRPERADLPAVRRAGRHQGLGQRLRLGQAAADQGHGEAAVRPVARARSRARWCRVAEFNLAQQEMVYFSHHVLLWADPATRMQNMSMRGGWKRMMAGLPLIMLEAHGPGHIALSDNHAGEVIALPLQHGQSMWVKEHRFLTATGNIRYDWTSNDVWYVTGDNDDQETHYPMGQFGDVFTATERPGLLLLHAPGNVFIRDLQQGQSLLIQPSSLVYQDIERPGPPAPGVPAEPGVRLLAFELRLPQHLHPDHRSGPDRGPVDLRAAGGDGNDQEPLLRDATPLVGRAPLAGAC